MLWVAGFAFEVGGDFPAEASVDDDGFTGHAVEFEEDGAAAFGVGISDGDELDEEGFAGSNLDVDFFGSLEAVEEGRGGKNSESVKILEGGLEVGEDLGIHEMTVKVIVGRFALEGLAEFGFGLIEVDAGGEFAGANGDGDAVSEDELLDVFGPAPVGLTETTGEHVDDGFGEVDCGGLAVEEIGRFEVLGDEEHGHITDHFRGRGDLNNVAEELVDVGVSVGNFLPTVSEAHAVGLLLEVGILAAGHLVEVDLGGATAGSGVEGFVVGENFFPVVGEFVDGVGVESGGPVVSAHGGIDGVEVGLRGRSGHGGESHVGDIDSGIGSGHDGGGIKAGGIVGMEVDGQLDLLLEGGDELADGSGMSEASHVLDTEDVRAHFLKLLGLFDVILERVFGAVGVGDVTGVADGGFANGLAVVAGGFHGDLHVGKVVEGVEDAEDVHAGIGGVFDESGDDIVGVVRVADGIGAAEEHLEADVGNAFPEFT